MPLLLCYFRQVLLCIATLALCVLLSACNRAAVRIPGASLSFPETRTGFVAHRQLQAAVEVVTPVDARPAHYGEKVAGTEWDGCRTDALWLDSAPKILRERLSIELRSAKLFEDESSGSPPSHKLFLKSEIHAFCSQAIGFLFGRIAGITSIKFSLEGDGKVIWEGKLERVVTDADAEYTGSQISFIEQALRTAMADSLRLVLGDLLKNLDQQVPETFDVPTKH